MAKAPKVYKPKTDLPLSEKEERVVELLHAGMTEREAAAAAGYKAVSSAVGQMRLKKAYREALEEIKEERRKQAHVTQEQVITGFKEAIADARLMGDPNAQIKGWAEIGKMLGYYAPEEKKLVLSQDQKVILDQLERMPQAQLLELADIKTLDVIDGDFEEITDE